MMEVSSKQQSDFSEDSPRTVRKAFPTQTPFSWSVLAGRSL